MKYVRSKAIAYCCFLHFVLCVGFIILSACGNGGGSGGVASSNSGSIVFDVVVQSNQSAGGDWETDEAQIDCDALGIATVEAMVYDANSALIAIGGPWPCEVGEGIITDIPAGCGLTLGVIARDAGGNAIYMGEHSQGICVIAGQTTDVGTITLYLINRPPVLDPIGPKNIDEGQVLEFTVTATDPDQGDVLTYTAENLPAGAEFDPAEQRFNWTPDYGDAGNYGVLFRVTDDGTPPLSDSEEVPIRVGDVPHPPVLDPITVPPVNELEFLEFYVTATDLDPGDVLTYSTSPLPTGAFFDPINQLFSWAPDCGYAGDHLVTFTVTDSYSLTDSEEVTITVGFQGGVNNPPWIKGPSDVGFNPGDEVSFDFSVGDPDTCDVDILLVYVFDYWGELPPGDEPELIPLGDSIWRCVWTPPEYISYRFQIVVDDDGGGRTWLNVELWPYS